MGCVKSKTFHADAENKCKEDDKLYPDASLRELKYHTVRDQHLPVPIVDVSCSNSTEPNGDARDCRHVKSNSFSSTGRWRSRPARKRGKQKIPTVVLSPNTDDILLESNSLTNNMLAYASLIPGSSFRSNGSGDTETSCNIRVTSSKEGFNSLDHFPAVADNSLPIFMTSDEQNISFTNNAFSMQNDKSNVLGIDKNLHMIKTSSNKSGNFDLSKSGNSLAVSAPENVNEKRGSAELPSKLISPTHVSDDIAFAVIDNELLGDVVGSDANNNNNKNNFNANNKENHHSNNELLDDFIARIIRHFPFPGTPRASPRNSPRHSRVDLRVSQSSDNSNGSRSFRFSAKTRRKNIPPPPSSSSCRSLGGKSCKRSSRHRSKFKEVLKGRSSDNDGATSFDISSIGAKSKDFVNSLPNGLLGVTEAAPVNGKTCRSKGLVGKFCRRPPSAPETGQVSNSSITSGVSGGKSANNLTPSSSAHLHEANNMSTASSARRVGSQYGQDLFGHVRKSASQVSLDTIGALAVGAFDLTAPAVCISEWLKERLKNFTQICGHEGTIVPATEKTLWKKRVANDSNEATVYTKLMADPHVRSLVPRYHREVEYKGDFFIEIEDLCHHFDDPAIMDVKLGTRTFLESEVTNPIKRSDLYKKMICVDPDEPTPEEHAEKAITKLRYMQFRERESSTAALGFRIEAIKVPGQCLKRDYKKIKSRDQVMELMAKFVGSNDPVRSKLLQRLAFMRDHIEQSQLFKAHEAIGSSILIIYDKKLVGAWLIDFAKVLPTPDGVELTHRTPWSLGNHEDGYLTGLDNLMEIIKGTAFVHTELNPETLSTASF